MIISPPFLPDAAAGLSEEAWLDTAMAQPLSTLSGTLAPEGSFPLSLGLAWHNGLHLQAPLVQGAYLSVRAIADGEVVFVHAPTPPVDDIDHPLNYNPFSGSTPRPAWTSDAMMVIAHRSEIGAAGTLPTEVVYYSACMHLGSLANSPRTGAAWKTGDRIYRKEEVGTTGEIYGHRGQVHFEICCDEANLRRLTGRGPDWADPLAPVAPTAHGRTDSVFGSVYVYLPASTPTSTSRPTQHLRIAGNHSSVNTLQSPQWVQITCDKGSATLSCIDISGAPIGTPRTDPEFEYRLYAEATGRHASLVPERQGASSPSGWYELLRFGRNLGGDPLPADAAHWREIPTATGTVWADLAASGTFAFSDADFLAATGWNCFADDTHPGDQRCDSLHMKTLIRDPDPTNAQRMERKQMARRLGEPEVRKKLRRAICRFPSEWDQASIEARHGWVKTEHFEPIGDAEARERSWDLFVKHARAVSFPKLPAEFLKADWRFHPREFVGVMRKCGWLSVNEFAQCFPRKQLHLRGTEFHETVKRWPDAFATANQWATSFNKANRRYGISETKQRLVHYFSHVIPETGYLKLLKEGDNSARTYLKNKPYWPYYGRGLIQLTWLENYKKYGRFRNFHNNLEVGIYTDLGWNPDGLIALDNSNYNVGNCSDSACFYIVSYSGMLNKMDEGIAQKDAIAVSRCVNGQVAIQNLNGLEARLEGILFLRDFLLDSPADALVEKMNFSWRKNSNEEPTGQLNTYGKPIKKFILRDVPWSIDVPLEKQRP